MIVLVPTVVPCERKAMSRQKRSSPMPSACAPASSASIMPREKSGGVEGTLVVSSLPVPSTIAQSVNVPPMSMPTRKDIQGRSAISRPSGAVRSVMRQ